MRAPIHISVRPLLVSAASLLQQFQNQALVAALAEGSAFRIIGYPSDAKGLMG
jgi:hypothetical protein